MVLTEFPELRWLKGQAEKGFADRKAWNGNSLPLPGWPTVILNVTTGNTLRDNIRGPLSIFTNLQGESIVTTGKRSVTVKDDLFFVSNHDQHYTLAIDQQQPAETFNIHFGEYFVDSVFSSLRVREDKLLDDQFRYPQERMEFHNTLYHRDPALKRLMLQIKQAEHIDSMWLEEQLYDLVVHLLGNQKVLNTMRDRLPVLKSSTRREILKRLLLVTDYIHVNLNADLSLEQLSIIGCLSKFHLLRLFKTAFRQTPHQYIHDARIRKAKDLLLVTRLDVREIARTVGFDNPSSFSRMFHNSQGIYPNHYRNG